MSVLLIHAISSFFSLPFLNLIKTFDLIKKFTTSSESLTAKIINSSYPYMEFLFYNSIVFPEIHRLGTLPMYDAVLNRRGSFNFLQSLLPTASISDTSTQYRPATQLK